MFIKYHERNKNHTYFMEERSLNIIYFVKGIIVLPKPTCYHDLKIFFDKKGQFCIKTENKMKILFGSEFYQNLLICPGELGCERVLTFYSPDLHEWDLTTNGNMIIPLKDVEISTEDLKDRKFF